MEQKMYKVFRMDICFDEYASDVIYVGGNSVEDIINHIKDIYPDTKYVVKREDWMSEEDWEELRGYGKYKEGDTVIEEYFTEKQMDEFKESLEPDNNWPRISEIPHMFTDMPYVTLAGEGYME